MKSQRPYPIPLRRINLLLAGFLVFCLAASYRIVSVQVLSSQALAAQAVDLRSESTAVPAFRGNILDANGIPLAINVPVDSIAIIPQQIATGGVQRYSELLAPLIGRSASDIQAAITQPGKEWVVLAHGLSQDTSKKISDMNLPGVVLEPGLARDYPMGSSMSQLIGFVNDNGDGSYGVEQSYNTTVGGTPGKLVAQRDADGNIIALANSTVDPPQDGSNLVLTINAAVQQMVTKALDDEVAKSHATGGTVVVQNPNTGAIIAMASTPTYNSNTYASVKDPQLFSNPAVSSAYEPGSTFKTLTIAIGLNTGVINPNTVHDSGYERVLPGGQVVHNALLNDFGPETPQLILENSSNLGAMWVNSLVGATNFYKGLEAFGIGKPTGVDLPGETGGILLTPASKDWSQDNLFTNAFGQGLAVSPLQLINAESAIANGGLLMQPQIVSEIQHPDGKTTKVEPKILGRPISQQVSQEESQMLVQSMDHSPAYQQFIAVDGYAVGAKTGTAQIPDPNGGYKEGVGSTIGSVIGFGPVPNPQFTVLVKIDGPRDTEWGENSAGPVFRTVMKNLFLMYGIPPTRPLTSATPTP